MTADMTYSIVYAHGVLEAVSRKSICCFEAKYFVRLKKVDYYRLVGCDECSGVKIC